MDKEMEISLFLTIMGINILENLKMIKNMEREHTCGLLMKVIQVILKYHSYECVRFDSTGCCGSMTSKETLDVENGAGICKFKYVFKRQIQVCFFRKNVNLWSALQQIYPVVEEFA